jgi:uncharacterized protein YdeI (YjbR/CyaY-like superfamily)
MVQPLQHEGIVRAFCASQISHALAWLRKRLRLGFESDGLMKEFAKIQVESRAQLRAWLTQNHIQSESIWLVTFKKNKGPFVGYDTIVEEAICFGWIDSRPAKLDDTRTMLLLSPRRAGSAWSKVNKERVEHLTRDGLIMPPGRKIIDQAKADGAWDRLNEVDALLEPSDLTQALEEVEGAQAMWARFPPSSRRGILEWINAAKRAQTRADRIAKTAILAAQGIKANFPEGRNLVSLKD